MENDEVQLTEFKRLVKLLEDYQENLIIDKNDLDTALVEQTNIFHRVGVAYADCISSRDFARNQLEKVKAELDRYTREDALRDSQRLTEAQIAHKIVESESYQNAHSNYLVWKSLAEKWLSLRESYAARAYVLRDLVQLFGMSYWERSIIKSEADVARDRRATDIRAKLVEKRRERERMRV
jgi:hypothetical protein